MPYDPVPVPTYPDVPYAPGVPAVLRAGTFLNPAGAVTIATADIARLGGYAPAQQWGLFTQKGNPLFATPDGNPIGSIVGVELKQEQSVPNYPIEKGSFGSYNKVQIPYDARITYAVGGSLEDRTLFLQEVVQSLFSLSLCVVVMPEFFYSNANIVHYDFSRRDGKGVGMLIVNIYVTEIRNTATSQFSSSGDNATAGTDASKAAANPITDPKEPSGASPTHNGTIQPIAAGTRGDFPNSPLTVG